MHQCIVCSRNLICYIVCTYQYDELSEPTYVYAACTLSSFESNLTTTLTEPNGKSFHISECSHHNLSLSEPRVRKTNTKFFLTKRRR